MQASTQNELKITFMHDRHLRRKANMAVFGGYDMPLWYESSKTEHLRVLTHAGVFDTSHMAVIMVKGRQAFSLLQFCITTNMMTCVGKKRQPLYPGRCVYGAFLDKNGYVIDDTIIFKIREDEYMVVVNAGMGQIVAEHLANHINSPDVQILDLTDKVGKVDIQGPMSAVVLKNLLEDPDRVFDRMPYFSFKGHFEPSSDMAEGVRLADGTPILLSRTGYTGEFGFEIFSAPGNIARIWDMILAAGDPFDVIPCGLAARDSLRAGAVLPLSHQDIGNWPFINHPWTFALPYNDDRTGFTKSFIGDQALINAANADHTFAFVGKDLRKVTLPATVSDRDGKQIGTVLTCVTDMAIGRYNDKIYSIVSPEKPDQLSIRGLSCGFVKVSRALMIGETVTLKDTRRSIDVRIESDIRPGRTARIPLKSML